MKKTELKYQIAEAAIESVCASAAFFLAIGIVDRILRHNKKYVEL